MRWSERPIAVALMCVGMPTLGPNLGCSDDTADPAGSGGATAASTGSTSASTSGTPGDGDGDGDGDGGASASSGAQGGEDAASTGQGGDGGSTPTPEDFWDASGIPPAANVMVFKFLNRTNGQHADDEVFWSFESGDIDELHSIAEQPTYDMPANASGRMYFYVCPAGTDECAEGPRESGYYDFIEHTIGENRYNGNTTRVDAFGLKIAMRLHAADGFEETVGEDYDTFLESREATFQAFLDQASDAFKPCAQAPFAPYRIVQPGAAGFDEGGPHADYYSPFVDALWAANGINVPKPGPNGSGLAAYPNLSAAIYRHVGDVAGTFAADGELLDESLWDDSGTFYQEEPSNHYARFWHARGIDGKAYGFPYDDVGSYSTYISHEDPEYMLVAIGW